MPQPYAGGPLLTGRAQARFIVEKADGSPAFVDGERGGMLRQGAFVITLDGYSAPVSAGAFARLVRAGAYDGCTWSSSYASVVAGGGAVPGGAQVPLEILPIGEASAASQVAWLSVSIFETGPDAVELVATLRADRANKTAAPCRKSRSVDRAVIGHVRASVVNDVCLACIAGEFEPVYRLPLDIRDGELPVLPLSIRGAGLSPPARVAAGSVAPLSVAWSADKADDQPLICVAADCVSDVRNTARESGLHFAYVSKVVAIVRLLDFF